MPRRIKIDDSDVEQFIRDFDGDAKATAARLGVSLTSVLERLPSVSKALMHASTRAVGDRPSGEILTIVTELGGGGEEASALEFARHKAMILMELAGFPATYREVLAVDDGEALDEDAKDAMAADMAATARARSGPIVPISARTFDQETKAGASSALYKKGRLAILCPSRGAYSYSYQITKLREAGPEADVALIWPASAFFSSKNDISLPGPVCIDPACLDYTRLEALGKWSGVGVSAICQGVADAVRGRRYLHIAAGSAGPSSAAPNRMPRCSAELVPSDVFGPLADKIRAAARIPGVEGAFLVESTHEFTEELTMRRSALVAEMQFITGPLPFAPNNIVQEEEGSTYFHFEPRSGTAGVENAEDAPGISAAGRAIAIETRLATGGIDIAVIYAGTPQFDAVNNQWQYPIGCSRPASEGKLNDYMSARHMDTNYRDRRGGVNNVAVILGDGTAALAFSC